MAACLGGQFELQGEEVICVMSRSSFPARPLPQIPAVLLML